MHSRAHAFWTQPP